jgi:type III pantothenate kinase
MNLVIDIGNTHTKLAWFEQGRLIETVRTEAGGTYDLNNLILDKPARYAIISSVGKIDPILNTALEKTKTQLLVLDHTTNVPLDIDYKTPETLGHDRIAAAAGAKYVCPYCNVMIVDMGTAITIDFISADGKFMGGNISPGLQIRFKALNEFTAKLPLITRDPSFPAFGNDTRTAIAAGVQQGIIYEINSYIDEFARRYPACEFIITGGDASFFVSKLKRAIFAIPDLVLKGLNYILEYNTSDKKP